MDIVKIEFNSDIVEIVDNFISVKKLCENMGLKYETQIKKIKADDSFESQLVEVKTAGGMQETFCIPYSKLNGWLFSISVNRVKPEVKQKLVEYKNECFDVLHKHFNANATPTQTDEVQKLQNIIIEQNKLLAKTPPEDPLIIRELQKENALLEAKLQQAHSPDAIWNLVNNGLKYNEIKKQSRELLTLLN